MNVGQRKEFLSGLLLGNHNNNKNRTNFNTSLISGRKNKRSIVELPGINHVVGSLNNRKRKNEFATLSKQNMALAKKLIDTRSIISYDRQVYHQMKVSFKFKFHFISLFQCDKLKEMISKASIRAPQYSMMRKSHSNFSEKSVMSARSTKSRKNKAQSS